MTVTKELYGADADGNRGQWIMQYEIDEDDRETIVDQLTNMLYGTDECDYPVSMEITLMCPYSDDDIQFDVDVKDYL